MRKLSISEQSIPLTLMNVFYNTRIFFCTSIVGVPVKCEAKRNIPKRNQTRSSSSIEEMIDSSIVDC